MSFCNNVFINANNNPQERYDKLLLSIQYFFKSTQKFIASILCVSREPWVDQFY
jgi:hypothetical protein